MKPQPIINAEYKKGNFSPKDLLYFKVRNISPKKVNAQIEALFGKRKYIPLYKPAIPHDGIHVLTENEQVDFSNHFNEVAKHLELCHFIPASGVGSRMFHDLLQFYEEYNPEVESFGHYINRTKNYDFLLFFKEKRKFPFYADLKKILTKMDTVDMDKEKKKLLIARILLYSDSFQFASCPKALLPFHNEGENSRTAFEEQIDQFIGFSNKFKTSELHFTLNQDQQLLYKMALSKKVHKHLLVFQHGPKVTFSSQMEHTHTILVDSNNNILRDDNKKVVFKPGGHGTLLENLNKVEADIIYISTIDNIATKEIQKKITQMREMLFGKLLLTQTSIFEYLKQMDACQMNNGHLKGLLQFLKTEFFYNISTLTEDVGTEEANIRSILNRPLRVCGVIANNEQYRSVTETTGIPCWIGNGKDPYNISLQIVQKEEVNLNSPEQKKIFNNATYFNGRKI